MVDDHLRDQFWYVYEIPERTNLASGFAFGGGREIPFLNVDWFGNSPLATEPMSQIELETYLRKKRYVKPGRRYLVLGSPGVTFVMEPQ